MPKWKQVDFKIPFLQGFVLKTAYTLKILRFLYSKYDFGMSRGMLFHVMLDIFLIYERVGFRTPFGSPFFPFLGHVGSQVGLILGPCWGPRWPCWGHFWHFNLTQTSEPLKGPILRGQDAGPGKKIRRRQVQLDCLFPK